MSLTDEEFRVKLEKHFSLYRINLRSPIASKVAPQYWYRVDILLVNELGLFRRADIEPSGQVHVGCTLLKPTSETGMTPLAIDDDYELEIRAAPAFTQGQLDKETLPVPGFFCSGKGTFQYRLVAKPGRPATSGPRYLQIKPIQLVHFPQGQETGNPDIILPLVIGPIHLLPDLSPKQNTSLPLELWSQQENMVYDGFRVFSTSDRINIAIHEMWDSGIPGKIWDSALVMLDVIKNMMQNHPDYIEGKHTLDLSAGTGLLGLYIASLQQEQQIIITELDEAVDLIDQNLNLNPFIKSHVSTKNLLWGDSKQAQACGKVDVIVASDVLYEAQFFEDLVKTFVDLSKETTRIYIGYKRRGFDEAEETRFWSLCKKHFQVDLLKYNGTQLDDDLVPVMTMETGVQLYRLIPL